MKLKKTDIGKKVLILGTNKANYISLQGEYKIAKVLDDESIIFFGVPYPWFGKIDIHFQFIEFPNKNMEVGDLVIITENTTTLKQGDEKVIIEFLCNDRNKIVVEGIIPGGWIEPKKLAKKIDISKFRIKKAIELFKEKGPLFYHDMFLNRSVKDILGKDMNELNVKQIGIKLVTNGGHGIVLNEDLYTNLPYELSEMVITKKPEFLEYYKREPRKDKAEYLGKKLSEVRKNFDSQNEDEVVKLCDEFLNNGGQIKVGDVIIFGHSLEVIKNLENEKQTPVIANETLPF